MRTKNQHFILSAIFLLASLQLLAQRTVETYYDLGRTKLHEAYTTTNEPPYRKHGVYKEFDAVGNLIRQKDFKNGKQHGKVSVYYFMPDEFQRDCYGKLVAESYWQEGKRHGWDKSWACNRGKLTMEFERFYENGEVLSETLFHRNGTKKLKAQNNGLCEEWNESGNLIAQYHMVDGIEDGEKTLYHDNGKIKMKGRMSAGDYIGTWISYHENGQLMSEFTVNPDVPFFETMVKYTDKGILKEEVKYVEGLHHITYYDSLTGNKIVSEQRKYTSENQSKRTGAFVSYYDTGEVKYRLDYSDPYNIEKAEVFNKNGDLVGGAAFGQNGMPSGDWRLFRDLSTGQFIWALDSAHAYYNIKFDTKGYIQSVEGYTMDGSLAGSGMFKSEGGFQFIETGKWEYYYPSGKVSMEGEYGTSGKTGEWKKYDQSGQLASIQTYSYGRLTSEESATEIGQKKFNELKSNITTAYTNYSSKSSNPIVKSYKYNTGSSNVYSRASSGNSKAVILEKATVLMNHYLSGINACADIQCLESIQDKLVAIEQTLKKYQSSEASGLSLKLRMTNKIDKIEKILLD